MTEPNLARAALCVFRRDITIALRRVTDVFTPLVFFAIVVSLFPLGVGPEPAMLRALAPGRGLGRGAARGHAVAQPPVRQ